MSVPRVNTNSYFNDNNNNNNNKPVLGKRKTTFNRTWTEQLGLSRTFTALGLDMEDEDAWTRRLYDEYGGSLKKGQEGDIPAPAGFASEGEFWRVMLLSGGFGVIMGFVGLGFLNIADYIPKQWVDNGSFDEASDTDFYSGKEEWILVTGLAGLIVGIVRYLYSYPDNLPGIFKEITDYHVDPTFSPLTVFISAISLAGGASLGPEQAMGNLGGGIATYVVENLLEFEPDNRKLVVLSGMSAALGALFPTPILGVLMIYELGNPPKAYMESVLILSFGACVAFIIYYFFMKYTYLEKLATSTRLADSWEFEEWQCVTAFIFGCISGAICLTAIICIGIMKQVFSRLKMRFNSIIDGLGTILCPTIGGVVVGIMSWVCPLVIGDGNMVLGSIVKFGALNLISTHTLITSAFAKMLTLAISMNCGFIGGFAFPMLTIGAICGVVAYQQYSYLPLGLCLGCFLAGVPAGICPMPFTLIGIPIYLLYFGVYQTIPIFICAITSYTVVCGSGLFKLLADRGKGENKNNKEIINNSNINNITPNDSEASLRESLVRQQQQQQEEQAFAVSHYKKKINTNVI